LNPPENAGLGKRETRRLPKAPESPDRGPPPPGSYPLGLLRNSACAPILVYAGTLWL